MAGIRVSKVTRALLCHFLFLMGSGAARAENPCEQSMNAPTPSSVNWPMDGGYLSSPFGPRRFSSGRFDFHEGVDIKDGETNKNVKSVQVGMARNLVSVTTPQNLGRHYGIQVYLYTITATDGMPLTHYCHLDESLVIDDAIVTVGQEIGISGDTGATNVHLHFEYWTCNAGGTPQHSQGNNLPSGGLYTCKKPPKPFILSPDANAPVIPPLDDPLAPGIVEYNDSVRVTLRMNSNELDLSWIEFRAKVNADLIIDESVSMWSHCNAGNEPNGDVQNGVSSVFQDDDGNVNVMRIDPDEFHSWDLYQQIKFTFKVPGYRPGTGRVCVKATDFNWNVGSFGTFNGECEFPNVDQPTFLRVAQNKPNPFNPSTTYRFETGGRMQVTARVYDSAGRYVATICDEVLGPGEHSVVWGGLDDESRLVGSGVYFVRVDAGAHQGTVRSVLLR